jgi:hypothetical protein
MLARLGDWVDERERRALGALVAFYLVVVLAQASLKLVWADELITFYISRQPGLTGIWNALKAGADPNPPLMHVMVKASTALLSGNALGMRVPAILCVLLAILAMWWMLRRWVRPVFALAGVLAFMATRGFDYSYDARSYAPMMGFAMASLALWMLASDFSGWRKGLALAGMAVALALGISSNYYCVLAFFPIAVGEMVGRRWRPGVWIAMAVASLPLFAYMPLIRHNIAEFGPHAWNRPQASMVAMSYLELVEGIFWPVLGLAVFAWWKERKANTEGTEVSRSKAEMAAVGVLLVYPFLGFAIAVGGAGMISPRCVAPVCCGIGLATGLLGQRVFGASRGAGAVLVLGLVVWVGARESFCASVLLKQRHAFFALCDAVAQSPGNEYVVSDSSFVLPLYYYSNDLIRAGIVFPVDFDAIHRFEQDDSGEENLWAGRNGVFPFLIGNFKDDHLFCCDSTTVVIARPDGWLANALGAKGITRRVEGDTEDWSRVGGVFTPMAHSETRILATGR